MDADDQYQNRNASGEQPGHLGHVYEYWEVPEQSVNPPRETMASQTGLGRNPMFF